MPQPKLFLHLGIPKAASTYLQVTVFPNLKGLRYYRKKFFKQFPSIVQQTSPEEGPLLFSSEMYDKMGERAENISLEFPDARVIVVFRRQDRWIRSKYKYYLWKNGSLDFRSFLDMYEDRGLWKQKDLFYQPKLEAVMRNFNQAPLILTMEELHEANGTFLQKLEYYTSAKINRTARQRKRVKTAFNEKQLLLLRWFNQRFPYQKPQHWPKWLKQSHMNLRQALNYLVALAALLIPGVFFEGKALIPEEDLNRIKAKYADDWQFIEQKASEWNETS